MADWPVPPNPAPNPGVSAPIYADYLLWPIAWSWAPLGYLPFLQVGSLGIQIIGNFPTLTNGVAITPFNLTASGGTGPYTFSVVGGSLPAGISLDINTGLVSGTPTVSGAYSVTIRATDNLSATGDRVFSGTVEGVAFSPTSLFTGGFQGAWYDFSDMSTLFQDSAGTTPVTAVEQPIGLVLDKSQGLVLGSELVTNGTFDTDNSGWTLTGGTAAVSGGVLTLTNTTSRSVNKQSLTTVVGQNYRITVAGLSKTGGGSVAQIRVSAADNFPGATLVTSNGNGVFWYTATATTTWLYFADGGATIGDTVSVDSISVKADSGNRAIQATSAKKPVLSARKNQQLYSEDISNAAYRKNNVTVSASPTNTFSNGKSGSLITTTVVDGSFDCYPTFYGLATGTLTAHSIFVKNVSATAISFRLTPNGSGIRVDLGTLAVTNFGSGTGSVEDLGGGEYRIKMLTPWTDFSFLAATVHGAIGASAHITGVQTEYGNVVTTYQRVTTSTDYNTVGFPHYAKFDGVDDVIKAIGATTWNDMYVSVGYAQFSGIEPWSVNTETANASALRKISGTVSMNCGNGAVATLASAAGIIPIVEGGTVVATSNDGTARRNGVSLGALLPSGGSGTGSFKSITLGANVNTTGNVTSIAAYQMVVLGRVPTAGEMTSTEQFIASKSGITL